MTEHINSGLKPFFVRQLEEEILRAGEIPNATPDLLKKMESCLHDLDNDRKWGDRARIKVRMALCIQKLQAMG